MPHTEPASTRPGESKPSILRKARLRALDLAMAYFDRRFATGSSRMAFICGHIRSGSTLLLHILSSNPAIIGYGETHLAYRDRRSFARTAAHIHSYRKRFPRRGQYVLDKIVWEILLRDPTLLDHAKSVFIIREPARTLDSIMRLPSRGLWDVREALDYYVQRLQWIRAAAARLDSAKWTFTTYDELVQTPRIAFERIEKLFGLSVPLREEYVVRKATGKRGDLGQLIRAGRIVRKERSELLPEVRPLVPEAQRHFDDCNSALEAMRQAGSS